MVGLIRSSLLNVLFSFQDFIDQCESVVHVRFHFQVVNVATINKLITHPKSYANSGKDTSGDCPYNCKKNLTCH